MESISVNRERELTLEPVGELEREQQILPVFRRNVDPDLQTNPNHSLFASDTQGIPSPDTAVPPESRGVDFVDGPWKSAWTE